MKKFLLIIIVLFIIVFFISRRFGFPNNRNPQVTKCYSNYGSPNNDLYDENVECFCTHDCFLICKPGNTIDRDDKCDRCGIKWKWHYNIN